jgi:DNA-binding MarR family transcriptional regulator
MENPDPKRAEEYTVLVEAWKINDELGPLTKRQSELLIALAQPIFEGGTRFADLETHTRMPKSTLSTVTNVLMKRGLVNKTRGNISLSENGRDVAQGMIDDAKNSSEKSIELALKKSPLNWQIETKNSSDATPLVRDGSMVVHPLFSPPVQFSSFAPPSLRERPTELHEPNAGNGSRKWQTGRGLI